VFPVSEVFIKVLVTAIHYNEGASLRYTLRVECFTFFFLVVIVICWPKNKLRQKGINRVPMSKVRDDMALEITAF
jgi:hypothetical protein